jgi:CubicO group peptidase (beta-lactamase class C family)
MRFPTLVLLGVSFASCAHAPGTTGLPSPLTDRLDAIATGAVHDVPLAGLSVAVMKGDTLLFARGYGFSNVEHQAPATEGTPYRFASVTKMFTAAAVLQLVEAGKVQLDEPVTKYLVDYRGPGKEATLRQLLRHTAGVPNFTDLGPAFDSRERLDLTSSELLALVQAAPADFPAGTAFNYSNTGYYLLGLVIEKVTGTSYARYLAEHVLTPARMASARYCDDTALLPGRAAGYLPTAQHGLENAGFVSMKIPFSAGALCGDVRDLAKWPQALFGGAVVSRETLSTMTQTPDLPDGTPTRYGLGIVHGSLAGREFFGHNGGINGFSSSVMYFPAEGLSVAVLINTLSAHSASPRARGPGLARRRPRARRLEGGARAAERRLPHRQNPPEDCPGGRASGAQAGQGGHSPPPDGRGPVVCEPWLRLCSRLPARRPGHVARAQQGRHGARRHTRLAQPLSFRSARSILVSRAGLP